MYTSRVHLAITYALCAVCVMWVIGGVRMSAQRVTDTWAHLGSSLERTGRHRRLALPHQARTTERGRGDEGDGSPTAMAGTASEKGRRARVHWSLLHQRAQALGQDTKQWTVLGRPSRSPGRGCRRRWTPEVAVAARRSFGGGATLCGQP